mgnify:CR=1 FL=1
MEEEKNEDDKKLCSETDNLQQGLDKVRKEINEILRPELVEENPQYQDSISVRIHVKPFMNFIWLGVFMIISGGLFSIIYRNKNQ